MSPTELAAVLTAAAAVLGAIGALFVQVRSLEKRVDGRLTELLELTRVSSRAEGLKEGSETVTLPIVALQASPVHDK